MNKRPGGALQKASDTATKSQIFPLMSKGGELTKKAYLAPALVTLAFVIAMFATLGKATFAMVLAGFLAFAGYSVIYQLCGKRKPWWLLAGVALVTAILMVTPLIQVFIFVFREILPGEIPNGEDKTFPLTFLRMFFGAGLMEELLKALPVLGLAWWGGRLAKPWRERIGVLEPLDGILIGAASGAGFTLLETLGQYVPGVIHQASVQYGEGAGQWVGLQLLIPRMIGSLFGHMAYSGYFGYFIGLSVLRPANRWTILGIGYLTAAAAHALWNSAHTFGTLALLAAGGIAYALLAAAILNGSTNIPLPSTGLRQPGDWHVQPPDRFLPVDRRNRNRLASRIHDTTEQRARTFRVFPLWDYRRSGS